MLRTSGFAIDVILPYNGESRPESKTTRMFRPFRQVAAPEMKSAVSNCMLLLLTGKSTNSYSEVTFKRRT